MLVVNSKKESDSFWSLKNLYFFIILLFSGLSTEFFRNNNGGYIIVILTSIYLIIYRLKFNSGFYLATIIWFIYAILTFITKGTISYGYVVKVLLLFVVSFTLINLYKTDLFYLYEKSIYKLSVISLIFFATQIIAPDPLNSFIKTFDISGNLFKDKAIYGVTYHSIGIYTILTYPNEILRNCGFCWEPGPFSIYIVLAILFNLYRNNFRIRNNKIFWILSITLLTTTSTTGIMAYGLSLIYIYTKKTKGIKSYLFFLLAITVFIVIFFTQDIFYSKINNTLEIGNNYEATLDLAMQNKMSYTGGRFGGLFIALKDFSNYPLLGTGNIKSISYGYIRKDIYVAIINGFASILSSLGLFGLLVFLSSLIKSSKIINDIYNEKIKYSLFIILLISSFSFNIQNLYIIFMFIFYSVFYYKPNKIKRRELLKNY